MHIDLATSRRLTRQIDAVASGARPAASGRLLARRAAVDDRFNVTKALAATVRYLKIAEQQFGRQDLAVESYHMGIGNLHHVLDAYDGGRCGPLRAAVLRQRPDPARRRLPAPGQLRRRLVDVLLARAGRRADHEALPDRPCRAVAG